MNIYYHPLYTKGIDSKSTFPKERYDLIKDELATSELSNIITIKTPHQAKVEDLYRAHSKNYVDAFLKSELSEKQVREIGLKPWSNKIIDRTLLLTGGSLSALFDLYKGAPVAANMAGGTHHAFRDRGSGFCIFNDLAICAIKAIEKLSYSKVLIIDLDVHQGDGTASILKENEKVYTFSVHCKQNFPFKKETSNTDIEIESGADDRTYLNMLKESLGALRPVKSDIIFFQAGVDTLSTDRY
jgi:acetoin utilization deacetylase AcuC-like enzyme